MSDTKVIADQPGQPRCPQCGTPLPAGAPAGLCPACLLKVGAAPDTITEGKQTAFVPPSIDELSPLFPQLEILELIGKGGMGAVYKARQKQLERIVALKILPPGIGDDPAFAERFAREAKALAKLNHPGIVTLYEFGSSSATWDMSAPPQVHAESEKVGRWESGPEPPAAGGSPSHFPTFPLSSPLDQPMPVGRGRLYYFLMEFVDGVNLRQLLHAGRVSAREALAIVPQICDALQFAHDQGIVHRDIKPENILLDRRGRVKVADFGLAKIMEGNAPLTPSLSPSDGERVAKPGEGSPALTDAGKVMGTPQYMSPEQIEAPGEVDHRADIYALGVVFYQMLTGELPGKKIEPPSRKVHIDVRLDEVVLRALEKKPELRYQQASVLKTQVETIAESSATRTSQSRLMSAATNQAARFSRTAIAGAIFLMALLYPVSVLTRMQFHLPHSGLPGWIWNEWWLIVPAVLSMIGTLLGWVATAQIRRSAGRLHGLGLAVFDGLWFPLLILDALLILLIWIALPGVRNLLMDAYQVGFGYSQIGFTFTAGAGIVVLLLMVNWFIIRRVWRAVTRPLNGAEAMITQSPHRLYGCSPAFLACASIVLALGCAFALWLSTVSKMPGPTAPLDLSAIVGIDRVIAPGESFDLDTGRWASGSESGGDLSASETQLRALGIFVQRGGPGVWDLPAVEIIKPFRERTTFPEFRGGLAPGPNAYVFRTREGSVGVLQFEGFNENPPGAKIRYKLVQTGSVSKQDARIRSHVVPGSKRQRFDPKQGMAKDTSWTVVDKPSELNPDGWAIMAHMRVGGVVPACPPGETNEFCRIKMTDGNDDQVTLNIEDLKQKSVVQVTLNRDQHAEILVDGNGYRVTYPAMYVDADEPDTSPFALVIVTRTEATPRPDAVATAPTLSFGPVVERVVADSKARFDSEAARNTAPMIIDFDTGSVTGASSALWAAGTNSQRAWMQTHGLDALGVIPEVNGLVGLDLKVVIAPPAAWDETTALMVLNQLAEVEFQETALFNGQNRFSTWLFQTREGSMGILQITGFTELTENPRGVKIRYKLVQGLENPKATSAPEHDTGGAVARAGEYKISWSNGVAFEIVGVLRNPRESKAWFHPDGAPFETPPAEVVSLFDQQPIDSPTLPVQSTNEVLVFYRLLMPAGVHVTRQSLDWQPNPFHLTGSTFPTVRDLSTGKQTQSVSHFSLRASQSALATLDLNAHFIISDAAWEPVAIYDGKETKELLNSVMVVFSPPRFDEKAKRYVIDAMHNLSREKHALRLVAHLKGGQQKEVDFHSGVLAGTPTKGFALVYPDEVRLDEVEKWVLERTPWLQGEIKEIAVLPRPAPAVHASAGTGTFGPVMELTLPDFTAVALTSGQVKALPDSVIEQNRIAGNMKATDAWMKKEGLDIANFGNEGLVGLEIAVHSLKHWENFSAGWVDEAMRRTSTSEHYIIFSTHSTNCIGAFKTRDGTLGLLQLNGYTDNPRGVKIRYKLAQADP